MCIIDELAVSKCAKIVLSLYDLQQDYSIFIYIYITRKLTNNVQCFSLLVMILLIIVIYLTNSIILSDIHTLLPLS